MKTYHMEKQGTYGRVLFAGCCDDIWRSYDYISGVINTGCLVIRRTATRSSAKTWT